MGKVGIACWWSNEQGMGVSGMGVPGVTGAGAYPMQWRNWRWWSAIGAQRETAWGKRFREQTFGVGAANKDVDCEEGDDG